MTHAKAVGGRRRREARPGRPHAEQGVRRRQAGGQHGTGAVKRRAYLSWVDPLRGAATKGRAGLSQEVPDAAVWLETY